jgi:hypothetical protein
MATYRGFDNNINAQNPDLSGHTNLYDVLLDCSFACVSVARILYVERYLEIMRYGTCRPFSQFLFDLGCETESKLLGTLYFT